MTHNCHVCGRELSVVTSNIGDTIRHCAACDNGSDQDEDDRPLTVLDLAYNLVHGDRRTAYGPIEDSARAFADIINIVLRRSLKEHITPHDAMLVMVGLKLCRESWAPSQDNRVDLAAYAHLADLVVEKGGKP